MEGDDKIVSITYKDLPKDLKAGSRVLIDDGLVEMRAEHVSDTDIVCTVLNGGRVSNHKGINVPGTKLSKMCIRDRSCSRPISWSRSVCGCASSGRGRRPFCFCWNAGGAEGRA